jgi:asparagine N-glycosylation enzyme membrane subunit Stt3
MWEAYRIGLALGVGIGVGGLLAAAAAPRRALLLAVVALAVAAGAGVGYVVDGWHEAVAGGIGGALGSVVIAAFVAGSLRRGGTRGGTAALVGLASLVLAALALVPVLGYLEAVALPALAARARRRTPERYAGLRSLARD